VQQNQNAERSVNMEFIVTAEQMQVAESNAVHRGVSLWSLAENAASVCFTYINKALGGVTGKTFTLLCGRGMNGGDGILLATLLQQAGGEVLCVFVNDAPNTGLARDIYATYSTALNITAYIGNEGMVKHALQNSAVIIDCVYGTGFRDELDYKAGELFGHINMTSTALKFSVDLPSGVNADTGVRADNAFLPNITLVLGAYKKSLLSHPCRDYCGDCVLLNIGLIPADFTRSEACFTDAGILSRRPKRFKTAHKGSFGRLLNIAGSERYIGAALLSTKAAICAGAGAATLAAPERVVAAVASAIPEAIFAPNDCKSLAHDIKSATAIVVGCGLGNTSETRKITEFVIKNSACPIILDADGINSVADNINILNDNKSMILTPHPAEFSRLTGISVSEIQSNRIDCAKIFARESGVIVVLKGVNTVIAAPDGRCAVNATGNAGLAKAGTGDVLAGVIGALAAQGVKPFESAVLGVYLHGTAADELAKTMPLSGITASEVAAQIGHI
jgi:NAD(P)H-hydrate epimerase